VPSGGTDEHVVRGVGPVVVLADWYGWFDRLRGRPPLLRFVVGPALVVRAWPSVRDSDLDVIGLDARV
jgi:hypothetical protein